MKQEGSEERGERLGKPDFLSLPGVKAGLFDVI
jgi:hypothetical protein